MSDTGPGRPRDTSIDQAVLEVARRHLAEHGYEAMSIAAVADEAGTSRQAVYRRWPSKAKLATAVIETSARATAPPATDDPYADLVAELAHFRRGVTRPDGLSMVGTMLQRGTDPELVRLYRERVVAPRRRRLIAILRRGIEAESLDADAELAAATLTGSLYGLALAGKPIPRDWPQRTAALVWRGLGGDPPDR